MADYFEEVTKISDEPKLSANWIMGDLLGGLNKNDLEFADCPVSAAMLGGMIKRITDNTISGKIAKQVFDAMWNGEGDADTVIDKKGLKQITDTGAIEKIVDDIIAANPDQVEQYRSGKDKVFGFFVGAHGVRTTFPNTSRSSRSRKASLKGETCSASPA